ncbi:MAG: nucleotidyltransferase family protein [Burkholderiales bacterium]
MMTNERDQILAALASQRSDFAARFGVRGLALFGSAARDELRLESDVDVLVDFECPATYDGFFALKDAIEALLGRRVDLVTEQGLKPRARRHVERDLVRVA